MVRFHALAAIAALAMATSVLASGAPMTRGAQPSGFDAVEVRRRAVNQGALAIAGDLRSPQPEVVRAALAAVDASDQPWVLWRPLAELASGWDRSLAAPAARAAARLARRFDDAAAMANDLADDTLASAAAAWADLAHRADRWTEIRVHALEVLAYVQGARAVTAERVPDVAAELLGFATDPDPEVRRAALELLPLPASASVRAALVARLTTDSVPSVRAAVAQAVCTPLPAGTDEVTAALGPAGFEALRALVEPSVSGAALLAVARCLAVDADPRSRRALSQLRKIAPPILRAAVGRAIAASREGVASAP